MSEHKFRCGDTARIEGKEFDIEVAYDDGRYASWCGWPNGIIETEKLVLVTACTDEEHRVAVSRWLDGPHSQNDDDGRRGTIERLYRPRAFWTRLTARARADLHTAQAHFDRCADELREVERGPADVEPLVPAKAGAS